MIRIFTSICFLVLGLGLPLPAKTSGMDRPTPTTSSKSGSKVVLAPRLAPKVAAKEQIAKKSVVTLTRDVTRGSVSPSMAAKQAAAPSPVIRNSSIMTYSTEGAAPLHTASGPVTVGSDGSPGNVSARLARVTAYWAAEGDYYTERCISSTGVRLHDGHCAVDPSIIPYGSVVEIAGVGKFLAVDTGSAVISRTAAREGGHTAAERHAIVIDVFFEDRREGEKFAAGDAKYVSISWWTPKSMAIEAKAARGLFAEEDWTKIQGKQL